MVCAYCDGSLKLTSPNTIDHFLPRDEFEWLTLEWGNLYPACTLCNSTYKGAQFSCRLLRPDVDPVDEWFHFDAITGALRPTRSLDRRSRARVRMTIRVFNLNETDRCEGRLRVLSAVRDAYRLRGRATAEAYATQGPYRFVARRFLKAVG